LQRLIWLAGLPSAIEQWGRSLLFVPKQPINPNAQYICEGLEFVIEHTTVIVLDFGNCGSIKLDPESSEPP
jgi:hypothetical protein